MNSRSKPEVGRLFEVSKEYLTETMLISAYDIHYGYLDVPRSAIATLTFVDSGGYETSSFQDLSATYYHDVRPRAWTEENLRAVYRSWPDRVPAVFVSLDSSGAVEVQARRASRFLAHFDNHLHAFLIKPRTARDKHVSVAEVVACISSLATFHVIGVTEKELGSSLLARMDAIATIRIALDEAGLSQLPIHVFGSLDPITVPLYFLAGAEIFDGLTWLRFGFDEGAALYRQNSAVRRLGVHRTDDQVKLLTMQQNLVLLSELASQMRRFLATGNYDELAPNSEDLRKAIDLLRQRNPRVAERVRVA